MPNYNFIVLDVKRKEPLITHLMDVCGIEPSAEATINDLQDAILAFEENNGYERPVNLLPERLKPQAPIDSALTKAKPDLYIPVENHARRKVTVTNMVPESTQTQEYFQINEYKILVKFDEEVELPAPMIDHIKDIKATHYKQESDGSITPQVKYCYSVREV